MFLKQSLQIVQIHDLHVADSQSEWSAKQVPWAEITQLILPHSMFIIVSVKNTVFVFGRIDEDNQSTSINRMVIITTQWQKYGNQLDIYV